MKTQKMSLANIKEKLSRAEMKKIMAGSGSGAYCKGIMTCRTSADCVVEGGSCICNSSLVCV